MIAIYSNSNDEFDQVTCQVKSIYSSDLNLVANNLIKSCVIIYTAVATCSQPCDVKLVVIKPDTSGQKS